MIHPPSKSPFGFPVRRYSRWLYPLINRYDYGVRGKSGVYRTNTSCRLEAAYADPRQFRFLHKLREADLSRHLSGEAVYYYTGRREDDRLLLGLDVDAHEGQMDALDAARWIKDAILPSCYIEPSTSGTGAHLFFVLNAANLGDIEHPSTARVIRHVDSWAKAVAKLVFAEGWQSTICGVYGTPSLRDEGGRKITKRGRLIKLPRPRTAASLDELRELAPVTWGTLKEAVMAATELPDVVGRRGMKERKEESRKAQERHVETYRTVGREEGDMGGLTPRQTEFLAKAKAYRNPLGRMRLAAFLYEWTKGAKAPSPEILKSFYEACGLHTDEDHDNERQRRAEKVVGDQRLKRWTPADHFDPAQWLPLIHQHVTPDVRKHSAVKYRGRVEDELLAAALFLYTSNSFAKNRADRMHTTGDAVEFAYYDALKTAGVLKAAFKNRSKRVAVGQLLELAGLIVLRERHRYGGRHHGVACKFGLGPAHPRFAEFVVAFGDVRHPDAQSIVVTPRAKTA